MSSSITRAKSIFDNEKDAERSEKSATLSIFLIFIILFNNKSIFLISSILLESFLYTCNKSSFLDGIFNSDLIDLTLVIISIIVSVLLTKETSFKDGNDIFQLLEINASSLLVTFFHKSSVIKGIKGCNLIKIKFNDIEVMYLNSSSSS